MRIRGGTARAVAVTASIAILLVATVAVHDVYCLEDVNFSALCRRSDGTLWRGPSGCDEHNDPKCEGRSDCGLGDSTSLTEPAIETCGWVYRHVFPAKGSPPYEFDNPPLSGGRYVR
jgi:hypothetical protein